MPLPKPLPPSYISGMAPCMVCNRALGEISQWFVSGDGKPYHFTCYSERAQQAPTFQYRGGVVSSDMAPDDCYVEYQRTGICRCGTHC